MIIREATYSDLNQLVRIHKSAFDPSHFTMSFPDKLLAKYFENLINNMNYKLIITDAEERVTGYLFADFNPKEKVNNFLKKNFIKVLIQLLKHPGFIREKFLELLKKDQENEVSELLSVYLIATDPQMKGRGFASQLLKYFENQVLQSGINQYSLAVRLNNRPAINFYIKNGFYEIRSNNTSIFFLKKIVEKS